MCAQYDHESSADVEAAKGGQYRLPILGAVKLFSKVYSSCWAGRLFTPATEFTELAVSGTRQISTFPYFSLGGSYIAFETSSSGHWPPYRGPTATGATPKHTKE